MTTPRLSIQQITEITGTSIRHLRRRANSENWPFEESIGRAGKMRLYFVEGLPEEIRLLYYRSEVYNSLPQPSEPNLPAVEDKSEPIESLTDRQRIRAAAKADLLIHYRQALKSAGYREKGAAREKFMTAYNCGLAYPQLYAELGELSWKTIERWKRILKKGGDLTDLADRRGRWSRGKSVVTSDQAKILIQCVLHPNAWKVAEVIREAKKRMEALGIQNGHSDATYYRWIEDFKKHNYAIWCFHRGGKKQWNDECALSIDRDPNLIQVGDVLVADGHKLNFEIKNPWTGKMQRMTLILFYDMRSNYPCGWELMPTENTAAISSALRRAILTLGKIPKVVYVDNGKAFKSKYFQNTDLEQAGLSGLYARLGIQTVFAWAYHGQSKTVERFFGTLSELERKSLTYCGTSIATKPPRLNRGEKLHRRVHDAAMDGRTLTMEVAHRAIAAWFDEYAHRPQKASKYLQGLSPAELFEQGRGPGIDPVELTYLMLSRKEVIIRSSRIRFMGHNYYHEALYNRRHAVEIRYDIQDPSYVVVYEKGEFLCIAPEQEKVHPMAVLGTDKDRELLSKYCKIKRGQEKQVSRLSLQLLESEVLPSHHRQLAFDGVTPHGPVPKEQVDDQPKKLTAEERERIEKQIASYKSKEKSKSVFDGLEDLSEVERYERLLKHQARGFLIPKMHAAFMRYFEQHPKWKALERRGHWQKVRENEVFLAQNGY